MHIEHKNYILWTAAKRKVDQYFVRPPFPKFRLLSYTRSTATARYRLRTLYIRNLVLCLYAWTNTVNKKNLINK